MDILTRLSIPELLPKQAMSEHTAQLGWWKSRALHLHWVRSHIRAGAVASQCSGTVFSLVCSLVFSLVFSLVGECCCEGLSVSQLRIIPPPPYNDLFPFIIIVLRPAVLNINIIHRKKLVFL